MKTVFSGIYLKQAGAGFCGQQDIVRTPSLSEALKQVCGQLVAMILNPDILSDEGRKYLSEIIGLKLDKMTEELLGTMYFEPCLGMCNDEDCREWHEVYGMTNGRTYCHVSECQLEPYEMEKTPALDQEEELPFKEWLTKRMGELISEDGVLEACKGEALLGSVEDAFQKKGYAEALQDILTIIKAGEIAPKPQKGDVLDDV